MSGLTLQDLAYFGAAWPQLDLTASNDSFVLGGGYANAVEIKDTDGSFIAGIVEKLDASGKLTDVVLTFSGTRNGSQDNITDNALVLGIVDGQIQLAQDLFS